MFNLNKIFFEVNDFLFVDSNDDDDIKISNGAPCLGSVEVSFLCSDFILFDAALIDSLLGFFRLRVSLFGMLIQCV